MNMIKWPTDNPRWRDTGEGGLYAQMVVPQTEANEASHSTGGCHVDTFTYLTAPDVCLNGKERAELWPGEGSLEDPIDDARLLLMHEGHREAAESLAGGFISHDQLSLPLQASVFLGATPASLWSDDTRDYFLVAEEHLTVHGAMLFAALQGAYGVRPLLLTFLDT